MRYISLMLIALSFIACNQEKQHTIQLTEAGIYNMDTVKLFLAGAADKSNEADKIFLQAIDMYRNQKNPAASIALFKRSIVLRPQTKAYYEMGNAFLDLRGRHLQEAVSAYNMADMLDHKPLSRLLYNTACAYALMDNKDSAFYYLISAIEFGYSNAGQIYKDKDLASLREDIHQFDSQVMAALSGASDPDKLMWAQFSREFRNVEFPLVVDAKYVKSIQSHEISYEFERFVPEMRDLKFSRDVGRIFYYAGKIRKGNDYETLLYAARDVMMDMEAPACYYLASFSKSGKLIDKVLVAGRLTLDEAFRVAMLQENGEVEVRLFNVKYAKDPAENGFEDNEIVEQQETGKEYYAIQDDGKILKKEQSPLAMR